MFQPFLRFYLELGRGLDALPDVKFQPFLRFYTKNDGLTPQAFLVRFQPFLRFYMDLWGWSSLV